jgi:hypothetical protein
MQVESTWKGVHVVEPGVTSIETSGRGARRTCIELARTGELCWSCGRRPGAGLVDRRARQHDLKEFINPAEIAGGGRTL